MKYNAIIFDLDDTLCNTIEAMQPAISEVFEKNLSHFPGKSTEEMMKLHDEVFMKVYNDPNVSIPSLGVIIWHRIFEKLNLKPSPTAIVEFLLSVRKKYLKNLKMFPGAFEILEKLSPEDVKVGILTNGPFFEQVEKIKTLKIEPFIDYMVTTDMCMADKPDKKAFNYILDKLHAKSEESVMIGDNFLADIVGGKQAGLSTIYIDHGKNDQTSETKPDFVISTLPELNSILQ